MPPRPLDLASSPDLRSQMGGIVCLRDAKGKVLFLPWFSKESLRVVFSILPGETIPAVAALDLAFEIRHTLAIILGREIGLYLFRDRSVCYLHVQGFKAYAEKGF